MGAGEDLSNAKGPQQIDGDGTIALVKVAKELGIGQFVLVTSVGTGKIGFPAGLFISDRLFFKHFDTSFMSHTHYGGSIQALDVPTGSFVTLF